MKTHSLVRAIRSVLVTATSLLVWPLSSGHAQETGGNDEAIRLDRVEVTGSRIRRVDVETSQPIFELDREDILAQGVTSIGDVIQNLTSHGSAQNSNVNNGGDGENQVDLRNLGPGRTLVLVNGRRWVGGTGLGGAVDLNSIPTAAVDRIEVLKDGASVIYGSDAIAGVVNVILRDEFDGAEANAYYGGYEQGDGAREAYDFTVGTATDRYSVMFGIGYVDEKPVFAGDREISREPIFGTGNTFGSSSTPFGSFLLCEGTVVAGECNGDLVDPDGTPFAPFTYNPGQSGADWRSIVFPNDLYNFAPENYLRTPQERASLFTSGRLNINDRVRFKAAATYNNRKSEQLLASTPVLLGAATGSPLARSIYIHEDSFYNPFDRPVGFINRRATETGGRSFNQDVDTMVVHGAFEGDFRLGDRLFDWEIGYLRGENKRDDQTFGQFSLPALRDALGPSFQDGPNGPILCGTPDDPATPNVNERTVIDGCVPVNLLGAIGVITPEMLDYISVVAHDRYGYEQTNFYGNFSGDLLDLPAGPLAVAAGLEHREEFGFDEPDALINSSSTTGNPRVGTRGGYDLQEAFVELSIPLLADVPFARQLDLSLATRTSDYSNFGSTLNSKIGVRWKPIDDLILRGNYTEGFRAPSVAELFAGTTEFFFDNLIDPCVSGTYAALGLAAQARCRAQGAPDGGFLPLPGAITRTLFGGNTRLEPEPSTTKTLGYLYSPEWAEGLNIAMDWWRIEFENTITNFQVQEIIDLCIVDGIESFCDLFTRRSDGVIDVLDARNLNIGGTLAEGYDMTVNYGISTADWGSVNLTWDTAYLARKESDIDGDGNRGENQLELPALGEPLFNNEGGNHAGVYTQSENNWRLRSNLSTRWESGAFGTVWNIRYYSRQEEDCQLLVDFGFEDLCTDPNRIVGIPTDLNGNGAWDGEGIDAIVPTPAAQNRLGSTTYHDFSVYWNAPWGSRITIGVNNALDRMAPRSVTAFANSFDPQYQIPGRFYYARYAHRF
jgi:iron complex outermembrane receptor protein